MNLNERIKQLRERMGLTQKEVADEIGVTERAYINYEKDRFPRDEKLLQGLAKALGTTVSYLIEGTDNKEHRFAALARSAEGLSEEQVDELHSFFSKTIDVYLKATEKK